MYPVKASYHNNLLLLSTQVNNMPQPSLKKANDFMNLQINFAKQDTGILGGIAAAYTKNMERLHLNGTTNENKKAVIKGSLVFKKPAIQAVLDLVKMF